MSLKVYANEHPKNKKSSKNKHIKLAQRKGNGGVSKSFMNYYNHFIKMGYTPEMAFDKASWHDPYKD